MPETLLVVLAPLVGPIVTAILRWLLPQIPPLALPLICSAVGTASAVLGGAQTHEAVALGGSGVAVREVINQAGKLPSRDKLFSFLVGALVFAPLFSSGCSSISAPSDTSSSKQQKALAIARTLSIGTCLTVSGALKQSERQQVLAAFEIVQNAVTNSTPDTYTANLQTLLGKENQVWVPLAASVAVTVSTLTSDYVDNTFGRELVLQTLTHCATAFTPAVSTSAPRAMSGQ